MWGRASTWRIRSGGDRSLLKSGIKLVAVILGAPLLFLKLEAGEDPLPTVLATRGDLLLDDDGSRERGGNTVSTFENGPTVRATAGAWARSPEDSQVWRCTWEKGMGHTPVLSYRGFDRPDLVAEITFRFGEKAEAWQHQCLRIAFDRRPDITGHIVSAWANRNNEFIESGFLLQHIRKTKQKKVIEDLLLDYQAISIEPDTWHTAVLEVVGDEALFRMGDRVAYARAEQIQTSKNLVSLTFGTTRHEVRRVRIWEAEPNPAWEAEKDRVLSGRTAFRARPHHYTKRGESLIAAGARLEEIASGFETVEGPLYDGKGNLFFTDIPNQHIWKLEVTSLEKTLFRDNTGGANGLAFDAEGRLLMCKQKEKTLARLEPDGTETVLLEPVRMVDGKPRARVGVNDVIVDRSGGIWVTVPGAGAVYRLDPDGGNPRAVINGLKGPNGLMLSPDEKRLYVSEYKEQRLSVFDVDIASGTTGNQRFFAEVRPVSDYGCDGMTVDDRGNLYCAGPHAVRVWNPDGELLEEIAIPESPTNCTFSGPGGYRLYITGREKVYRIQMKTQGVR